MCEKTYLMYCLFERQEFNIDSSNICTECYRFSFNGKECDNEVKGVGNHQDYGMRVYDARLGRFLSVDPLAKDYPWYTPYQFAGNTPIQAIDLDGLEPAYVLSAEGYAGNPEKRKACFKVITATVLIPTSIALGASAGSGLGVMSWLLRSASAGLNAASQAAINEGKVDVVNAGLELVPGNKPLIEGGKVMLDAILDIDNKNGLSTPFGGDQIKPNQEVFTDAITGGAAKLIGLKTPKIFDEVPVVNIVKGGVLNLAEGAANMSVKNLITPVTESNNNANNNVQIPLRNNE